MPIRAIIKLIRKRPDRGGPQENETLSGTPRTTVRSEAAASPLPKARAPKGKKAVVADRGAKDMAKDLAQDEANAAQDKLVAKLTADILTALDDSKAEEIISIDLAGKTAIADTMFIATGRSNTHVGSIADRVLKACKAAGVASPRIEGLPHCDWVLVDAGDVIVHVFRPEVRQFYNLEKMWSSDRPNELQAGGLDAERRLI
jgi:ribosome-associated protein